MPTKMRKLNFGAGPATLPEHVLSQFCNDLIDFEESGVGIGELSHRTELFEKGVLEAANSNLAKLTGYGSEEWQVLWMTGGGTGQFAAVPMNFDFSHDFIAVYLVTGCWSEKAAEEAKKLVGAERVVVIDLRVKRGNMSGLREPEEWIEEIKEIKEEINYVYYCDNETVDGIEIPEADYFQDLLINKINSSAVFVADTSSNFLSRELPKSEGRTGLVFAGVQKNLGAAGVTVVLIKKSVLATKIKARHCPSVMDYEVMAKHNSLLNTPPVIAIHLCNLVLKDLIEKYRGLKEIDEFSKEKSGMIYGAIKENGQFYCPVAEEFRSRMNVIFKSSTEVIENEILRKAEGELGMIQLKGHRSVGGLRASLYNAVTLESTMKLAECIKSIVEQKL